MGIWISTPGSSAKTVEVTLDGTSKPLSFSPLANSHYGVWNVDITGLAPKTKYFYQIWIDGVAQSFEAEPKDFNFSTLGEAPSFVFMSCHGIDEYEKVNYKQKEKAWDMWGRLLEALDADPEIAYAILGGDQVYMDKEFEAKRDFKDDESDQDEIRKRIFSVYKKYWSNPLYRKVFFRIPAFLMWDDHDLLDGFGSRAEQFGRNKKERDKWQRYRKYLAGAFFEFQASRNPGALTKPNGPYSFSFKQGATGFVMMDLRSQRNSAAGALFDDVHRNDLTKSVDDMLAQKVRSIIFVSPVTLTRMGGPTEQGIGQLANALGELSSIVTRRKTNHGLKPVFWGLLSAVSLFSAQMLYQGKAGYLSTILALLLCILLALYNAFTPSKNILGRQLKFWHWIYAVVIVGIVAAMAWWDWSLLGKNFEKEIVISILNTLEFIWPTLALLLVALMSFSWGGVKDRNRQDRKWSKRLGAILSILLIFNVFWTGLPERKDVLVKFVLLPNLVMQVFGLFCFMLAALEALGIVEEIAGLDDDLKDSWSSQTNAHELAWFRQLLHKVQSAGVKVTILAGDIHTGGISKLSFDKDFKKPHEIIAQVVSSPMSYVPMAGLAEKLTSGASVSSLIEGHDGLYAYNLFYRSERNFVVVRPKADGRIEVDFHFEDVKAAERFIV